MQALKDGFGERTCCSKATAYQYLRAFSDHLLLNLLMKGIPGVPSLQTSALWVQSPLAAADMRGEVQHRGPADLTIGGVIASPLSSASTRKTKQERSVIAIATLQIDLI